MASGRDDLIDRDRWPFLFAILPILIAIGSESLAASVFVSDYHIGVVPDQVIEYDLQTGDIARSFVNTAAPLDCRSSVYRVLIVSPRNSSTIRPREPRSQVIR
jgi:hypothetical protein